MYQGLDPPLPQGDDQYVWSDVGRLPIRVISHTSRILFPRSRGLIIDGIADLLRFNR